MARTTSLPILQSRKLSLGRESPAAMPKTPAGAPKDVQVPKRPSHEPAPRIQDASSPLLLLFYRTQSGRAAGGGKPPGPLPRPRAPQTLNLGRAPARPAPGPAPIAPASHSTSASAPAPPGLPRPAGTAPSYSSQSIEPRGVEPEAPALLSGHQLAAPAVAHEVAPRTRLPPFPPPSLQEKTAVGPRRSPTAGGKRRGEEPGN